VTSIANQEMITAAKATTPSAVATTRWGIAMNKWAKGRQRVIRGVRATDRRTG